MITCILGLGACGEQPQYTEFEQSKITSAQQIASGQVIPLLVNLSQEENMEMRNMLEEYTYDEVAYEMAANYYLNVDGYAFMAAITSFDSTLDDIGMIVSLGEPTAVIDDKQIIVYVEVRGSKKNAEAEIIFSNDRFMIMESAALNTEESMGELMLKAGMNTLIGMGTVFLVLILISLIISCFRVIPKIQAHFAKGKENRKNTAQEVGIENGVTQIIGQEETVDVSDDLELVAVIAAAIAASEGQTSTEGFVVRSIRRR